MKHIFWRISLAILLLVTLTNQKGVGLGQVSIYQTNENFFVNLMDIVKNIIENDKLSKLTLTNYTYNNESYIFNFVNVTITDVTHDLKFIKNLNTTGCVYKLSSQNQDKPATKISFSVGFEYLKTNESLVSGNATFELKSNSLSINVNTNNFGNNIFYEYDLSYNFIASDAIIENPSLSVEFGLALDSYISKLTKLVNDYFNTKFTEFAQSYVVYPISITESNRSYSFDMSLADNSVCNDNYTVIFYRGSLTSMWNKTYASGNFINFDPNATDRFQIFFSTESLNDFFTDLNKDGISFRIDDSSLLPNAGLYLDVQTLGNIIPQIYEIYTRTTKYSIESSINSISIDSSNGKLTATFKLQANVLVKGTDNVLSFEIIFKSNVVISDKGLQLIVNQADAIQTTVTTQFSTVYRNTLTQYFRNYFNTFLSTYPYYLLKDNYTISYCDKMVNYVKKEGIVFACSPVQALIVNIIAEKHLEFLK